MTPAVVCPLAEAGDLRSDPDGQAAAGPEREHDVPLEVYRALAAFRLELRRGLAFSKDTTEANGLPPVQYQALLAIKASDGAMSVSDLAHELLIEVNSAVELARRLVTAGLVSRRRSDSDRRSIVLSLTADGEERLARLAARHLSESRVRAPGLIAALTRIVTLATADDS